MQAPPAFSITVTRFGVWHALRLAVAASACAAAAAWGWHPHAPSAQAGVLPWVALLLSGVLMAHRPVPFRLRWDTRGWSLDGQGLRQLRVAIDTGDWLLLRVLPVGARRARWLPIQRLGHESGWHTLRCTVHGARPVVDRWTETP